MERRQDQIFVRDECLTWCAHGTGSGISPPMISEHPRTGSVRPSEDNVEPEESSPAPYRLSARGNSAKRFRVTPSAAYGPIPSRPVHARRNRLSPRSRHRKWAPSHKGTPAHVRPHFIPRPLCRAGHSASTCISSLMDDQPCCFPFPPAGVVDFPFSAACPGCC